MFLNCKINFLICPLFLSLCLVKITQGIVQHVIRMTYVWGH